MQKKGSNKFDYLESLERNVECQKMLHFPDTVSTIWKGSRVLKHITNKLNLLEEDNFIHCEKRLQTWKKILTSDIMLIK